LNAGLGVAVVLRFTQATQLGGVISKVAIDIWIRVVSTLVRGDTCDRRFQPRVDFGDTPWITLLPCYKKPKKRAGRVCIAARLVGQHKLCEGENVVLERTARHEQ
jgi:hypothetical protein